MTQTVVLLADQPVATLRALGVSRVVSQSEWVEPGSRVRIGATEEKPERDETIFVGARRLQWFRDPDDEWWLYDGATCQSAPLPLGVVVGTAVVAACVEANECDLLGADPPGDLLEGWRWGDLDYRDDGGCMMVPEQDWHLVVPGAWCLMLDDAKPVSARCPRCFGTKVDRRFTALAAPCLLCSGSGVVDDPGASGLRVEEWTP